METQTNPTKNTTASEASFRAFKNVTISLNGFTTFPAKLVAATSEEKSPFRLCVTKDGKASPVSQFYTADNQEYFTIGQLGRAVENGDQLIPVTAEELASTKIVDENKKAMIEIEKFVPLAQVDPTFFCNSYVLVPNIDPKKGNPQAANLYHLLMSALISSGRVGTAKMYDRDREYNIIIRPNMDGTKLMLHTIYTSAEVRNFSIPQPTIEMNSALLQAGLALITAKFADFDPNGVISETDGLVAALALRKKAQANGIDVPDTTPAPASTANTADALLNALTASLTAMGVTIKPEATPAPEAKATKRTKKTAA
jgi:non-homologous end joining protein Ku